MFGFKKKSTKKVENHTAEEKAEKTAVDEKKPKAKKTKGAEGGKGTKKVKRGSSLCSKIFFLFVYFGLATGIVLIVALWIYSRVLSDQYKLDDKALGGALWELPSRVYARPQELYVGSDVKIADLQKELQYLEYVDDKAIARPGTYHIEGNEILINKKPFTFWDGKEKAQRLRVRIKADKVSDIIDLDSLETIAITRLEPLLVGSIYPKHGQDRILINLSSTPSILVDTILAAEDRRFYSHPGIDPKGLMRAAYQAIKTGKVKQGASTLTQQFVKNHYLTNERKISRKVKEALMALKIESNHTKQQILEGYLNEIFLGQDGKRAIHGFGLAAHYYFGKSLDQLGLHQIASLVALIKEPSQANPFRHPDFAKRRRALILDIMVKRNLISSQEAELAKNLPLDTVSTTQKEKQNRYSSFLQLVINRIKQEYDAENLAEGLNIFTSLDPIIQEKAEQSVARMLPQLEKNKRLPTDFLQAASVIVNSATAEIVAIVGDRNPNRHGFNRAFQAQRQPGSLLKPVVYMSALEYPARYTLATMIDDSPLEYRANGEVWKPKNYSKNNKGFVPLINGLVHSYNIPTARIALDIGIDDVVQRLQDLGARDDLPKYPSIVLGSVAMSPLEVTQIYESLANGGYRMPLRVIRSVTDAHNQPVQRYGMESVKVISNEPYYLTIRAMQDVVRKGTAASMRHQIPSSLNIAGKTGTTDDYRDSWFAGFTGNYLNVVWVGNDDNQKTRLSGSSGALKVWMDIMKQLPLKPLNLNTPERIVEREINMANGLLMDSSCRGINQGQTIPFIVGSEPQYYSNCMIEGINLESIGVQSDGANMNRSINELIDSATNF